MSLTEEGLLLVVPMCRLYQLIQFECFDADQQSFSETSRQSGHNSKTRKWQPIYCMEISSLTFISSVIITVLFIARPIALRTISSDPFSYRK
jgi:hypothetical protein